MAIPTQRRALHDDQAAWQALVGATERAFETLIGNRAFPCLGAKAAQARRGLQFLCVHDLASAQDDCRITGRLQAFAMQANDESLFTSLVLLFPFSIRMSEHAFETVLWQRLRAIHAIDRASHGWDGSVSADPASANFSMSVGGKAFYVVGMHPGASRPARRFCCPALVFNLHSQFEQLRRDGRYEKLRKAIIKRDTAFAGSVNPMLAVHGKSSEARQYSGRQVDEHWVCPFHAAAGTPR